MSMCVYMCELMEEKLCMNESVISELTSPSLHSRLFYFPAAWPADLSPLSKSP